jgi:cephalosporin hydroxylase
MRQWRVWTLAVVLALAVGIGVGVRLASPEVELSSASTQVGVAGQPCADDYVLQRFHHLWFYNDATWRKTSWMGIPTQQNPMDVWVIQELLVTTRPDFVVECGSYYGGSAALWATLLAQVNPAGRVISIDIADRMEEARKLPIVGERVDFLLGSSTDPAIVADVARRVQGGKVFVILDSLHTREHVLEELRCYAPMVRRGGYVVVQDTNTSGHPVRPRFAPGPGAYEAVAAWPPTPTSSRIQRASGCC